MSSKQAIQHLKNLYKSAVADEPGSDGAANALVEKYAPHLIAIADAAYNALAHSEKTTGDRLILGAYEVSQLWSALEGLRNEAE